MKENEGNRLGREEEMKEGKKKEEINILKKK